MWWLAASLAVLLGPATDPRELPPTPAVAIEWSAPPGCPTAAAIEARIVELVGRRLGTDPSRVFAVTGTIAAQDSGFVLDLVLREPDGTEVSRRLEAQTCAELGEPAAVVVAIAVVPPDEDSAPIVVPDAPPRAGAPPFPSGAPATIDAADPLLSGPTVNATRREPRRSSPRLRPRGVLGVLGGVAGGVLPSVGGALQATLGLSFEALRIDLVVTHEFRRRVTRERGGGMFDVTAVRPELCWTPGRGRWRIPLCGGPEVGVLRAGGFGVDVTRRVQHVWFAVAASAGVGVALHRFVALRLRTELVVAPMRREFTLDGAGLSTTGPIGARATLGVEAWFP